METLSDLLEKWTVLGPGVWENENSKTLRDWYAVASDEGIIAYFTNEKDAYRFRLSEINRELNN